MSDELTISKRVLRITTVIFFLVLAGFLLPQIQTFATGGLAPDLPAETYEGEGSLIIYEYSDFQCPYCGRFTKQTLPQIETYYGDHVTVVYKHFPLNSHPQARKAAEASECARDQGKFREYHDALFDSQFLVNERKMRQIAEDLKLNTEQFNNCLDSGEKASIVQADYELGIQSGVRGTPSFMVGNQLLRGAQPFSVFQQVINAQLN